MSAPKQDSGVLICEQKRRYPDELTARANASVICEEFALEQVGVYPCPHCKGWHISTKSHGRSRRVTASETFVQKQQRHGVRVPQAAEVAATRG